VADDETLALAAVLWFEASSRQHGHDPGRTWSSSGPLAWPLRLVVDERTCARQVTAVAPCRYRIDGDNTPPVEICIPRPAHDAALGSREVRFERDGVAQGAAFAFDGDTLWLKAGRRDYAVRETLYAPPAPVGGAASGSETGLRAPMSGKVVAVFAAEGDSVRKGQRLAVVEAMKMQHELVAPCDGVVARILVKPGSQVASRQLLIELKLAN
jgi:geranyl-CoA carboxylase alpha subunit